MQPSLVTVDGQELALSRKDAALLALLAVEGACAKDHVAAMLWPDADSRRSRLSLRQRRFRLARAAGVPVVVGEDTLRLNSAVISPLQVGGEPGDEPPETELLGSQPFDDCPDFLRWLQGARPAWRRRITARLEQHADQLEAEGRLVEALALARRLAEDEPLSDRAHRRLIWLLYLQGDLGRALGEYKAFCDRLAEELGELPDDATGELVARIRLGEFSDAAARTTPGDQPWRPPFVGRDAEMAALQQAWVERRPMLVEGMPGIGKTRLIGEALRAQPALCCLHVPVFAGERHRPHAVLARLLTNLWLGPQALRPDGHRALPDWARRELAALLPELHAQAPAEVRPLGLQRALECALAQAGPDLVVIDDLQEADQATLDLLPALSRPGLPPWWLVCRQGERPAEIETWLQSSPAPQVIELLPLDQAAVGQLLAHASPGTTRASSAESILRSSGGVTFLVVELIKAMSEGRAPEDDGTPQGAAHFIRSREASLEPTARQMAHTAAVLRAPLTAAAAAAIWDTDVAPWQSALRQLEAVHWVDAQARMHDLVASALYDALPLAERRALHARLAAWMEREGRPPADAAQHHEAAGQNAQAAPLFERAAAEAARACRVAEQARFQRSAAEAWLACGRHDESFRALRASVDPLLMGLGAEVAQPVADLMLAQARGPLQHVQAHIALAELDNHRGRYLEAEARVVQVMPIAQSLQDANACIQLGAHRAYALVSLSRLSEATEILAQLEPLLDQATALTRKEYVEAQAVVCWRSGQLSRCADYTQTALDLLLAGGHWGSALVQASNLAGIQAQRGRFRQADEMLQGSLAWREMLGPLEGHTVAGLDTVRAWVDIGLGRGVEALAVMRRALGFYARATELDRIAAHATETLARIHLSLGQVLEARAVHAPLAAVQQPVQGTRSWLVAAAIASASGGDPQPALDRAASWAAQASDNRLLLLRVAAERLCCGGTHASPADLAQVEQQARDCEQDALAARVAWHHVGVLLTRGEAAPAAELALRLLDDPGWAEDILPCHWQWLGALALQAVADPQAAVWQQQAQTALARSREGLPPAQQPAQAWPRFAHLAGTPRA
ncbi:AAA family ATPase [Ideonella sp. 4Y16]|uniref:AAA family ATPase n=1 Tax=Ideonella alba TaxID=2824118 RepID=A0A940Y507_9BURK|nr:AAA family ATPase [Ideonella alba]MBQ0929902.1 AAA family ATPase [Ideonella alba]MBQ0942135.1 AAA family ATPase [Ideonella alba]